MSLGKCFLLLLMQHMWRETHFVILGSNLMCVSTQHHILVDELSRRAIYGSLTNFILSKINSIFTEMCFAFMNVSSIKWLHMDSRKRIPFFCATAHKHTCSYTRHDPHSYAQLPKHIANPFFSLSFLFLLRLFSSPAHKIINKGLSESSPIIIGLHTNTRTHKDQRLFTWKDAYVFLLNIKARTQTHTMQFKSRRLMMLSHLCVCVTEGTDDNSNPFWRQEAY